LIKWLAGTVFRRFFNIRSLKFAWLFPPDFVSLLKGGVLYVFLYNFFWIHPRKFLFSNCQNFPFKTVKICLSKTVKIFLLELSKLPFPNCQKIGLEFDFLSGFSLAKIVQYNIQNPTPQHSKSGGNKQDKFQIFGGNLKIKNWLSYFPPKFKPKNFNY
jgi:hypothetical protein